MKEFVQHIVNEVLTEETTSKNVVAIYPGRFQPMGSHHAKVYKWVQSKFGRNNSYISTSTKVEKPKSPLSFSEKEMVIRKHGFKNIIQINAMYNGEEYFKKLKFKPTETALVMIVGEKDGERLSPKYFQKISQSDNLSNLKPYLHTDEGGNEAKLIYWMAAPHISLKVSGFGEMSGTTIRAALGQSSDNKEKLFKDIMGFYDKRIYDTIVPKFEQLFESLFIPKSVIERWAKTKSKSKLNEISISLSPVSAKMVDDGPNFYIPNNKVFMNVSLERAAKLGWEVVKQITSDQYDDYYEHPIYPQGPPKSVPDAENPNASNEFDVDNAQEKWLDHMTRKMALVGWSVVKDKAASDDIKTDNEIIKQSLGEGRVEGGEPEAMYVADGQKRRLNRGKPESWYKQLGFTQVDVPTSDWMRGRLKKDRIPDLQTRKVYYKVDNVKHSTLKDALKPVGVDKWIEVEEEPKPKKKKVKLPESVITEIPMDDLVKIDKYADKQLNPVDVVLTDKHFFDRLTDLRNDKPITSAELIGFFKRLSKSKKKFIEFLKQYGEVVAKDNRTNINIPFMTVANKLIAKTVMRKSDFKTSNPKFAFEGLFTTDNALKPYEKLLIGSIIEFMRGKYGISSKIIVKKKQSRDLFGDIVLNDNTLNKDKFYLHFNPNASYSFIIESIIHELIHVKQISKGELRPSSDYKELLWKGKPAISVSDYKKFQRKDYNEYKKLPWEAEAYSGMKPLYREFLKSKQLQSLKGKDENLDYIISNLTENLMMGYPDQKWIDDHNKELKRLRNKFDDNEDDYYTVVDEGVELEKFGITDFKSLFNKMPSDLKKRVYNLKNISQRLDKHPEGNVLKHTIVVVNRSLKDDDIDIAIAAMFHDIGKDETEGIHPTKGHITHYGHEDVSATLVSKYKNWIKSVGGNPANILYIVRNHMRYKQLSNMRPHKQNKLKSFRAYDKLDKFSKHDRGGLHESSKLVLQIPSDINKIHTAFKKNGKKLYVVGGAVRDAILGNTPKDFDLATDAKPDEVISIANKEGFKTTEVGKSFGVVTVNGHEIATFRKDFGVGRRPISVDYTDIEGDVKRRDLTINALFYDIDRKEIVDLVGGIQDLKNKKIRTVGDATTRFDEDPLRKLRILRFQSKLGGKLDNDSFNALKKNPTLKGVSADRIKDEFVKSIQTAKNPKSYMELVDELGFTPLILPTLNIHKSFPNENDYIIFLSSILRNNDVKKISNVLNTLKYSNKEINDIVFLVSLVNFTPERIYEFKKLQASTTLSDNQIIKFGSLIGKDVRKFIKFNLSVKGSDVPTDIKGSEIGNWIRNKEIQNYINEDITLDVNIGDTILMGRFKNKKVVVKSIGTDEHGMPTINGKKVVTFRKLKTEGILQEGGAAGHMMHLSDDLDLTFGELKQIVKDVLQGNIKTVTEKLDGQNLMVSWKGGKAIFARNKGHIKGFGAGAMDALGVKQMFSGRGDLEEAFYTAAFDLQNAISKLTQKQRDKIFGEGSKWMNFEVMYPATTNVIPYNHTFLVFHGSVEYDESGNPIGGKGEDANILAGMIKQVNANLQSKYEIRGPVKLTITPAKDFKQSQSKYLSQINKLQSEFKLKDSDKVGMYHYKYWETFVDKKSPTKLDDVTKNGLVLRWAYDDKSFRLDKNTLTDAKTLEWAKGVDKGDLVKLRGENMNKFDVIFLQLGAEVLKNMSGFLAANPDAAVQSLRKEIEASIPKLMASDDPKMIEFATRHIQRLETMGGVEAIVPTEGIVFNYNGKLYKMVGAFAPLNQLLGAFRYGR